MERDANLAGMDQDLESATADRAQWRDMFALVVSQHHVVERRRGYERKILVPGA